MLNINCGGVNKSSFSSSGMEKVCVSTKRLTTVVEELKTLFEKIKNLEAEFE